MATTGVGFRWLDILEKEFDKACVELDSSLTEIDCDEPEVVSSARQKIATLSSCFSQLTHKALTIFQHSAKMEAELVDMRAELVQARAAGGGGHDSGDGVGIVLDGSRARAEAAQLARENAALRETVLALHSELFGARLATKYLDKELAGRIQQLQLLGRNMRAEVRDPLWAQVEAEILLQRHKTLVRVCRGLAPCPPRPPRSPLTTRPRTVRVRRSPHLGLGISITGGREHDVPVLISELEAGGPAALTGQLFVGDAILAINDVDLTQACHKEAVRALQSVKGDCALCVQFIATDDDDQLSDDNFRFPLYPDDGPGLAREPDGSGATPTAPRTPDYDRPRSEVETGSECESMRCDEAAYIPTAPLAPYPDYNALNNNLSILDMDDDTIEIETGACPGGVGLRVRGAYRGVHTSSNDSARSTPVHARRPNLKKKRVKPLDWKIKGAYRAVDDPRSSDEGPGSPSAPRSPDEGPGSPSAPRSPPRPSLNGHGISTVFDKPKESPVRERDDDESKPVAGPPGSETSDLSPPPGPRGSEPSDPSPPAPTPAVAPPPPLLNLKTKPFVSGKSNGLDSKLLKNKAFRIGSAKRVQETVPGLANGDRVSYPTGLLAGDGDPDFGTPV